MVTSEFINIIRDPASIQTLNLEEIEQMCLDYPYAIAPKIVKAKLLKEKSPVAFKSYLKTAAIYAHDRKMLYRFLIHEEVREKVSEIVKHAVQEDQTSSSEDLKEDPITQVRTPLVVVKDADIDVQADVPDEPEISVSEKITVEEHDSPIIQDKIESEIDQLTDSVLDELIMSAVPTYNIETAYPINDVVTDSESTSDIKEEDELPLHDSEKSFLDWLDNFDQTEGRTSSTTSQKEIIDSFIEKQPRIRSVKGEQPSIIDLSSTDRSQIVTETLARIYLKQENYKKAIQVYEQLILNIPEKKGYFASQIHFLENLLKKD